MTTVAELPVLLVDDEPALLQSAGIALRAAGVPRILTLDDSHRVPELLAEQDVGVIVLDLTMPGLSGHALLEQLSADHPDIPVIVMTATNDLDTAVHSMQAGAVDYLVKPVDQHRLASSIRRALDMRALQAEVLSLKDQLLGEPAHVRDAFADIITQDRAMLAIFRYVAAIAASPQPVLITGETGTGKELIARSVHRLSQRPGDLVTINVAGLDDALFSDTLFGHTRGAYTGAERQREGVLTTAGDGTLFLDEIGDLTVPSQVKILRLLQDGSYYLLGADHPRQSRARLVVATNVDVARSVADGTFRKDLYYRLRTHHLHLPPLRDRPGDVPLLVHHFVDAASRVLNRAVPSLPPSLFSLLKTSQSSAVRVVVLHGPRATRSPRYGLASFDKSRSEIVVMLNAIHQVIRDGLRPAESGPTGPEQALGLALGRVIAHEIGHYLLGIEHAPSGLMRAMFEARTLVDPRASREFSLDAPSRARLRERLRQEFQSPVVSTD